MISTRWSVCLLSVGLSLGVTGTSAAHSPAPANVSAAPAAALWGPPVLCHPVAFAAGDVESLPFGKGRFATMGSLDRATIVELTVGSIGASDDTFFHMETLRRALIYLAWGDDPLESENERLVVTLEGRVKAAHQALESSAEDDTSKAQRALGLAAFDLAWTLEGLGELGLSPRTDAARDAALEMALAHRADDDALQLGAAILSFARNDQQALYQHLGRALRDVEDETCLLARNADNTIGPFMGVSGTRALLALCEKKSKRS